MAMVDKYDAGPRDAAKLFGFKSEVDVTYTAPLTEWQENKQMANNEK